MQCRKVWDTVRVDMKAQHVYAPSVARASGAGNELRPVAKKSISREEKQARYWVLGFSEARLPLLRIDRRMSPS